MNDALAYRGKVADAIFNAIVAASTAVNEKGEPISLIHLKEAEGACLWVMGKLLTGTATVKSPRARKAFRDWVGRELRVVLEAIDQVDKAGTSTYRPEIIHPSDVN